jgi:DNA-binding CsgD family transcriptional regulator
LALCSHLPQVRVFEALLTTLNEHTRVAHRAQSVAFLSAAKDLYSLIEVGYACANIPILGSECRYSHCVYTSALVGQWVSTRMIADRDITANVPADDPQPSSSSSTIMLKLPQYIGEAALLGLTPPAGTAVASEPLRQQLRILGSYFHQHILRLNGHRLEQRLLLSARELECLKWTAEGKTAWEASVILGISERTVRFHLNAAREKLQCATTTQAVAKAVRDSMIEL